MQKSSATDFTMTDLASKDPDTQKPTKPLIPYNLLKMYFIESIPTFTLSVIKTKKMNGETFFSSFFL